MALVAPLRAFGRADVALAGGKGANLGELVRAGFPVPDGFVVTTEAYASVVRPSLRVPEPLAEEDAAGLRKEVEAVAVPDELRAEIADAYAALAGDAVAVRSSATAEDLPGAAFAGQQDTYLGITGMPAVIDAVRRCWASLWTDRAVAYRRRLGIDPLDVSIAVVVQRMVAAEMAGVLFTANPVSGDRDTMVVEASSGLGEAVVSGLVTPDRYVLDRRGTVREWTPGRHELVLRAAPGGGVARTPGDPASATRLGEAVLTELARLGGDVAGHFGRPQDVEWACAEGRIWLLQARPMTALPPPPLRLGWRARQLGSVLLEYVPVRPYPIDMSTWLPYGPAGLMADVVGHFGIANAFDTFLQEIDGVVDRLVPPTPRPTLGVLRAPFRVAALARRYDPGRWTDDPRLTAFEARVRELAAQDPAVMPWQRLIRLPREVLAAVRPITDLRIDYLPRSGLALLRLLALLTLLRRRSLLGDLTAGAKTRTGDANRALEALAARVHADPTLAAAVAGLDLERLRGFPSFWREVEAYRAEYGHRETATPLLVTPPTLGESPETLLGLITVLAARPPRDVDGPDRAVRQLLAHPLLRSPRRRARVERWVEAARAGIAFREDSHFAFTTPLPVLRRSLIEIGRRLCDAGVLDAPDQVFHLRLEELERLPDPAELTQAERKRVTAAVRARSARRDELAGVRLVDPAAIFPRHDRGSALVSGTPASAGTATGPVRVIREPAEFGKLRGGDVLVCPYTNPSWTPLFQRAAAAVVDAGGFASHAAIVAREYGIPAVMGTATGTTVLRDGQVVTVDGDRGSVSPARPDPEQVPGPEQA